MNMDVEGLRSYLKKYGQEHCLDFWDTLSAKQQETLYKDLKALNLEEITKYFNRCEESLKHPGEKIDDHLQPLPAECFGSIVRTDENKLKLYESEGGYELFLYRDHCFTCSRFVSFRIRFVLSKV